MVTYVALLRGINVGGRNRLPMAELVEVLTGLGLRAVRTYIQSGNVVFAGESADSAELAATIGAAIGRSHGFIPAVIVLTAAELDHAIAANPFGDSIADPKSLHLFFAAAPPDQPDWERLARVQRPSERYQLVGSVFYLHAPDGIGRSKLAEQIEPALGVPVTARNWRSVSAIHALTLEDGP